MEQNENHLREHESILEAWLGQFPSLNETLSELLGSSRSLRTHKERYLPIVKYQIIHLNIDYAICGFRVGPLWRFNSSSLHVAPAADNSREDYLKTEPA